MQVPGRDRSSLHTFTLCFTQSVPSTAAKKEPTQQKKSAAAAQTAADVPDAAHGSAPSPRTTSPGAQGAWPMSHHRPGAGVGALAAAADLIPFFPSVFCPLPPCSASSANRRSCSSALGELKCRSLQQNSWESSQHTL